jgi:hypothetical protein
MFKKYFILVLDSFRKHQDQPPRKYSMKKFILTATILLTLGCVQAQTADYFVKNGDLMVRKGNTTSTFQSGGSNPIIDFAEGELNGKYYLIYWRSSGESKICTITESGKWSSQSDFRCQCGKEIENIKFLDSQTMIITCSDGKRYKKTMTPGGGSSERSY